jgi:inositol-pentakisphosphate 2-kinase
LQEPSLAHLSAGILSDTDTDVASEVDLRGRFTEIVTKLVLSSPVLPTLARLQRTLDGLDIEGLHALLGRAGVPFSKELLIASDVDAPDPIFSEPEVADWADFVQAYNTHFSDPDHALGEDAPEPDAEDRNIVRYHLLAYLLSMSFKDCSIILNFHPGNPTADRISVIDLDPKTVRKIGMWEALDKAIINTYAKVPLEQRKVCVDAASLATPRSPEKIMDTTRFLVMLTFAVGVFSFMVVP